MKNELELFHARMFCALALGFDLSFNLAAAAEVGADTAPARTSTAIPWSQIGAKAGADYKGDGWAVISTGDGARLRCAFQRLEGEATSEGLWLTSTLTNRMHDRFRLVATAVRRTPNVAQPSRLGVNGASSPRSASRDETAPELAGDDACATREDALLRTGTVAVKGQIVRFIRPGLVEEYTVSMDGVRQDFVVLERPAGAGELAVQLAVSGAKVEWAADGVRLVLENSGRKLAYSRLRATDATGKELTARMEVVQSNSKSRKQKVEMCLVVVVNDADAVYPVRIDPTFSDANWISMNPSIPGANDRVSAAVVDGSGNLYICGYFTLVGDVIANHIAKWNGSSWSALGSGIGDDHALVNALAVSGSNLYAGGEFTTAGGNAATNIAKWNGSGWTALGSGINGEVYALGASGSDVYAGGYFFMAGGGNASCIAKWDGSNWSALGSGINGSVVALAVSGSDVYVGGGFTYAGATAANNIAKWNGNNWSALGSGMNEYVFVLAVSGSDVYAGGYFTRATNSGGAIVTVNSIAKWNGSSWTALGSGMDQEVRALAVSGSDVYAGGSFTTAGGSAASYIAKWNGSNWSALGSAMNGVVYTLAASGSNLYAGGYFTMAGGGAADSVAKWVGSNWTALGSGMNYDVYALAVSGSDVYAGGNFTQVGGSAANYIAKWNGSGWSALGSGMNRFVSALAVSGSELYAGGAFTTAGGSVANRIAKWDGSSWIALGSGMNDTVRALAVSGSDVYAGGGFTMATNSGDTAVTVNSIARWDGSNWTTLGSGMSGDYFGSYVYALAVSGSDVYAGGNFATAGGSASNSIARWNGTSWTALGSGVSGFPDVPPVVHAPANSDGDVYFGGAARNSRIAAVYALAVLGGDVYAGGDFWKAGGSVVNYVAKWDGSSWTALGSGLGGTVRALAVSGDDLYAGGNFTAAGGGAANRIAKWNGSSWSALGSGMSGRGYPYYSQVNALAVSGSNLYAGGDFTTAGGKVSGYIARAYVGIFPTLSIAQSDAAVTVSWPSADTADFVMEQTGALVVPTSWIANSANVTDDGINKSVTLPATNSAQFFRLRRP